MNVTNAAQTSQMFMINDPKATVPRLYLQTNSNERIYNIKDKIILYSFCEENSQIVYLIVRAKPTIVMKNGTCFLQLVQYQVANVLAKAISASADTKHDVQNAPNIRYAWNKIFKESNSQNV